MDYLKKNNNFHIKLLVETTKLRNLWNGFGIFKLQLYMCFGNV